jgi:hypothetical protein
VSTIKEHITCPRKFTLQYIEKAQPFYRASALVVGTAWQETIGHWLNGATNTDELRAHLRDGIDAGLRNTTIAVLSDDEGEDQGTMTDSAIRMLDVFLAKVARPEITVGVEVAFALELSSRHSRP